MAVPAATPEPDELVGAILAEYEAGVLDPHRVAYNVIRSHSLDWLVRVLLDRKHHFVAEVARQTAGGLRRASVQRHGALHPTRVERYLREIKFQDVPVYLGHGVYKRNGDLTAEDCREVAVVYQRRADALLAWSQRYERLAALIEEQGVETLDEASGVEDVL